MGAKDVAANLMRRMSNRLDPPAKQRGADRGNPRLQRLAKKTQQHEARIARLEELMTRPQRPGKRNEQPEQRPNPPTSTDKMMSIRKRYGGLRKDKVQLIDFAFRRFGARSFADLGGVGKVDGGYTFYTLDEHRPERGVLADVRAGYLKDRAEGYPALDLVEGNFGEEAVAERVGSVDALYLFAVLLHQGHQGAANWDDILELYADRARLFLVHNPQWTGSEESVRLSEFAREEYRENTRGETPLARVGGPGRLYAAS
jgi:hypothetical protein